MMEQTVNVDDLEQSVGTYILKLAHFVHTQTEARTVAEWFWKERDRAVRDALDEVEKSLESRETFSLNAPRAWDKIQQLREGLTNG